MRMVQLYQFDLASSHQASPPRDLRLLVGPLLLIDFCLHPGERRLTSAAMIHQTRFTTHVTRKSSLPISSRSLHQHSPRLHQMLVS